MLLTVLSVVAVLLPAETSDSLQAVTLVADRGLVVSRTDTVRISNSISIADALAGNPGLCVMDNGGPAGLITVSLRGGFSSLRAAFRHCGLDPQSRRTRDPGSGPG